MSWKVEKKEREVHNFSKVRLKCISLSSDKNLLRSYSIAIVIVDDCLLSFSKNVLTDDAHIGNEGSSDGRESTVAMEVQEPQHAMYLFLQVFKLWQPHYVYKRHRSPQCDIYIEHIPGM